MADWPSHKQSCTKSATLQLLAAIKSNKIAEVRRLALTKRVLNGKVDYVCTYSDGKEFSLNKWTALHQCVREGNTEAMRILVDSPDCILEIKDADGETPLFVASTDGNPELAKILLEAGANPNAMARDGWSCLMMAARDANYDVTKALLEAGADMYGGRDMFGRSVLDILSQMQQGQGIRMQEGESYDQVLARYKRVHSLLLEYA
jgi:ankyrin repeat protein